MLATAIETGVLRSVSFVHHIEPFIKEGARLDTVSSLIYIAFRQGCMVPEVCHEMQQRQQAHYQSSVLIDDVPS